MKKTLFLLLLLASAYILVTRFTYYDNPQRAGSPDPYPCTQDASTPANVEKDQYPCSVLEALNQSYKKEIEPIFEAKCLMCHGMPKQLPLYAKLPLSKALVDHDMREAVEDINMTWGFPFRTEKGVDHGLEEIKEVIEEGSMPPLVYKVMHWKSGLTHEEKTKILSWVGQARAALRGHNPPVKASQE